MFHLLKIKVSKDDETRSDIYITFLFLKDFTYLFLETGEGKEKERERNINVWLSLVCPLLGTWPTIQAGALTRNQTSDPLVPRLVLDPQSYISQGLSCFFKKKIIVPGIW